jgi:hypothetical protein
MMNRTNLYPSSPPSPHTNSVLRFEFAGVEKEPSAAISPVFFSGGVATRILNFTGKSSTVAYFESRISR